MTMPQPLLDVDGLEDLDLLGQGQVGRVPGHVGHPARIGHVGQSFGQPTRTPAQQDVLDHGPVLAGQLGGLIGGRVLGDVLDLDPEGLSGAGHGRPQPGPVDAPHGHRRHPTGQLTCLHDLGHHPDGRVRARR